MLTSHQNLVPHTVYEVSDRPDQKIIGESKDKEGFIIGWMFTHVELKDGIKMYIEGADYPQKGLAPPEAIVACNILKRLTVEGLRILLHPAIAITFLPLLMRKSFMERLLASFNSIAVKVMESYILKYEYLSPTGQFLNDSILTFLIQMGLKRIVACPFAKYFSHLVEYDGAYKFRVQDLLSETTTEKLLADPQKEIKEMLRKLKERDIHPQVVEKFARILNPLAFLLKFGRIKKAWQTTLKENPIEKAHFDDGDKYWICHRNDYKFMGMSYEQRVALLSEAGLTLVQGKRYSNV